MLRFSVDGSGRTGPRSGVYSSPGDGVRGASRRWTRTIAGQTYGFTVVDMPDGEVRWAVTRFNGYPGGPQFGCAWSPHRYWALRPGV